MTFSQSKRLISIVVTILMMLSTMKYVKAFQKPSLAARLMRNSVVLHIPSSSLLQYRASRHFSTKEESQVTTPSSNSMKDKLKTMWNNYGYVAVGSYLGLYIMTLSSIFFALDFDIFQASTIGFSPEEAILKVTGIFETVTGSKALPGFIREHPTVGTFAVAWVITKFTEPLRLGVTIAAVPKIAKFLGKGPRVIQSDVIQSDRL